MKQQLTVSFSNRKDRVNQQGKSVISVRVNLNGRYVRFQSGQYVEPNLWNSIKGCVKGKSIEAQTINIALESIKHRLTQCYLKIASKENINLDDLMDLYKGKMVRDRTLLELVTYHNNEFHKRLDVDRSYSTYEKYVFTEKRLKSYIKDVLHVKDVKLKSLDNRFIQGFYLYLRGDHLNQHNTVTKYVKNVKHLLTVALEMGWIDKHPFLTYRCTYKDTPQVILSEQELHRIEEKRFSIPRLELVRNLFVFQCYTGLSYVDMAHLSHQNIVKGMDGKDWIFISRSKTETAVRIPLLQQALNVLLVYNERLLPHSDSKLLPVYAIQKMNAYLKEIADLCDIPKNLSSHVGRRTFATTVLLSNGISIESVSKLLGHKNIAVTQVYAKVVDQKVSAEMGKLELALKRKAQ